MSASDDIDRQLAAAALQKKRDGEIASQREMAALKRVEKLRKEQLLDEAVRSIPKKKWQEWSGRQVKVINEQAERYGLAMGGPEINLPEFVRSLHEFFSTHGRKLAQVVESAEDALAGPSSSELDQAKLEYLQERTRIARLDADARDANLLPRDLVHQTYAKLAANLRRASEVIYKRFGPDAYQVLVDAVAAADDQITSLVGSTAADGDRGQVSADALPGAAVPEDGCVGGGGSRDSERPLRGPEIPLEPQAGEPPVV